MFWNRKKPDKGHPIHEEVKKLVWTVNQFSRPSGYQAFSMRVQGTHPVTGGMSVAHYDGGEQTLDDIKRTINAIFFGLEHFRVKDFCERAKEKVRNGYACEIKVSGRDAQGDSLDYEIKFGSQDEMLQVLENGLYKLTDETVKGLLLT